MAKGQLERHDKLTERYGIIRCVKRSNIFAGAAIIIDRRIASIKICCAIV